MVSREIATTFSGGKCIGNLFRNCFGYFFGNRFGNPLRSFGVLSVCFMLDSRCQISGETARILSECTAVTSGTGTWDGDVGLGLGDVGLGDAGLGDSGTWTWDSGT